MSFSRLTEEEKKQYIISVIISALMTKFYLDETQAEELVAASSLQRMLDDGYTDYVLGSDEEYWIDQIIANNDELQARKRTRI